jgi:hypothetical protein
VSASWAAPATDGGSPIIGFTVSAVNTVSGAAISINVPSTARTATVGGLANGASYQVRVTAANAVGASPDAVSAPVITTALPGAPTIGAVVAHVRTVSASWLAPADNGGSPITSYMVTAVNTVNGASTVLIAPPTARGATVGGLVNGGRYLIRVAATNAAGVGLPAWSGAVTTPNVPGIVRILPAASGSITDRAVISATANWLPPLSTGGSVVTRYRVIAYRFSGARLVSSKAWPVMLPGTARSLKFGGLLARGVYRFRVQAVNAVGAGAWSAYSTAVVAR